MSEISSGLVAVAWIAPDEDRFRVRICEDRPTDAPLWSPMCWVSDAEAIIAQKDAEILEQCRINSMGAEREAALLGKVERQSAALKLAREALGEVQDLIGESHGVYGLHLNGDESPWGELEQGGRFERLTSLNEALAAINEVLKGE